MNLSPECVRRVSLALGVGQLLANRTPWAAVSAVNSEDPTQSQRRRGDVQQHEREALSHRLHRQSSPKRRDV